MVRSRFPLSRLGFARLFVNVARCLLPVGEPFIEHLLDAANSGLKGRIAYVKKFGNGEAS